MGSMDKVKQAEFQDHNLCFNPRSSTFSHFTQTLSLAFPRGFIVGILNHNQKVKSREVK